MMKWMCDEARLKLGYSLFFIQWSKKQNRSDAVIELSTSILMR